MSLGTIRHETTFGRPISFVNVPMPGLLPEIPDLPLVSFWVRGVCVKREYDGSPIILVDEVARLHEGEMSVIAMLGGRALISAIYRNDVSFDFELDRNQIRAWDLVKTHWGEGEYGTTDLTLEEWESELKNSGAV